MIELLYPSSCLSCGIRIERKKLCIKCNRSLLESFYVRQHSGCVVCDEQTIEGTNYCPACLLYPEAYRRLRSIWTYQDCTARLIKKIKYQGRTEIIPTLISRLENILKDEQWWQIETETWPPWDLVVGLPSTRIRDFSRGYRHTAFFARDIAATLNLEFSIVALKRRGLQSPQVSIKIPHRRENIINSFKVSKNCIRNKQILLVDDVCTSGSSVAESSKALIQGGALTVDVLTISRSSLLLKNRLISRGAAQLSKLCSLC